MSVKFHTNILKNRHFIKLKHKTVALIFVCILVIFIKMYLTNQDCM